MAPPRSLGTLLVGVNGDGDEFFEILGEELDIFAESPVLDIYMLVVVVESVNMIEV